MRRWLLLLVLSALARPLVAGAEPEADPWARASELEVPSFLAVAKRPEEQDRPPADPALVEALRTLEAEVERYEAAGQGYRDIVTSIVRRDYLRQRRNKSIWYDERIRAEDDALDEARESAIRKFERFIQRYPYSPEYTPDAMFRLGELYFERSARAYHRSFESTHLASESEDDDVEGSLFGLPDFRATVSLYRTLLERFPDYERLDGVYYLIGYCLNEMGRTSEAIEAWLALVCANQHTYPDPQRLAAVASSSEEAPDLGARIQAATARPPGKDHYDSCTPVHPEARFVTETWFRIGEHHFDDYGNPHALHLAISAYTQILSRPDDRNYNLALYKIAWTYFRAGLYPEAVAHFGKLVDWSDEQKRRFGHAGSELRPEAIRYLGFAFAYDDWNENNVPDEMEGLPRGIDRVQDPKLLPQDRPWTAEAYFTLGDVYFDEAKYPRAIEVWRLALSKWPHHLLAPHYLDRVAQAHREHNQFDEEMGVLAELSKYTEGSTWWNENLDHPVELREAEKLAEQALIRTALHQHVIAQQLRAECVNERDVRKCIEARAAYDRAADGYRNYLVRYPNHVEAYDLHMSLADALFWSEQYEEAAAEYAAVRDSNLDDRHLSEAARMVVESLKRVLARAEEEGKVVVRDAPPEVEGDPPRVTPIEMPLLVQRIALAQETYVARVKESQDTEQLRGVYDYNNAILLYAYGYWEHSRRRLARIFEERCEGPHADETGRIAWENLAHIALQLGDTNELERLASRLEERRCSFGQGQAAEVDCTKPENAEEPICRASGIRTAIEYRRAMEIYAQAEKETGETRTKLFERAATLLVAAVNKTPDNPQAPIALELAASALEKTQRFDSAARLYQRILDEVGPRVGETPEEQERLDAIVSNAYFQLAANANRFFDFDKAVANYRILADSPRFARSTDPNMKARRVDALVNAAIIYERLGRYAEAKRYFERVYQTVDDPETKRLALYRIAEIDYAQAPATAGLRAMREFIAAYKNDPAAATLVVRAYWFVAEAVGKNRPMQREHQAALEDVVRAFDASGLPPGSVAAEYAAQARFMLVDRIQELENWKIDVGKPKTLEAYVQTLMREIERGAQRATAMKDGYEPVIAYNRPGWVIAAYVRQGRVYELLTKAVLELPFVMPEDLNREMRGFSAAEREEVRFQIEDRIRQVLDAQARPFECLAVVRFALASRVARASSFDDAMTQLAIDRLQAYGEERIAQCIEEHRQRDTTFEPYRPGEFTRAPRGLTLPLPEGVSAPAIEETP
ncbi:MAG: tetratricopeptide repeat protein [Myxococcales bacterium]|nr:tetratricopeptide repeat protein [Myxococcales bacterium]